MIYVVRTVYQFYPKSKAQLSDTSFNFYELESNSADLELLANDQTNDTHKTKILGLQWDKSNDIFTFVMKDLKKLIVMNLTRKEFVQFFDSYNPLRLINH